VSWLAILLSLASLGGSAQPSQTHVRKHCAKANAKQHCKAKAKKAPKAKVKPRATPVAGRPNDPSSPSQSPAQRGDPDVAPQPTATPKPGVNPAPTATPTPTPSGPVYPSRTGVDLTDVREWAVRPSYRILAAGRIDFNVNNLGEDDHNLSIRGGGREYGRIDLHPRDDATLTVDLAPGAYTLYCSLPDHEAAGMRADISVR
jgi:hypothetical protein